MPLSLSILAAIGAMLFWGVGDFLIQRETRKVGDLESLAFIGTIGAFGLLPFILPELPSLFEKENIVLLAFAGVITFVTSMLDFEALKEGKLSVIEVVLEIELPLTAILGFLFLRETLSLVQLATISVIFIGIIMISVDSFSFSERRSKSSRSAYVSLEAFEDSCTSKSSRSLRRTRSFFAYFSSEKKFEKGVLLAVMTAVGMALMNFTTAVGSRQVSPLMIIWLPWLMVGLAALFLISRREGFGNLLRNGAKFKQLIIVTAAIDTFAWLLYATALAENELAITTAITESYPAIGIILGVWINREEILPHQYAGAFLALLASISLALTV